METKSIIKRVKGISHEVWSWFRFLFFQAASIGGAWMTCFHLSTTCARIAEVWSGSNLLYIPDLLFALFIGAVGVMAILGCIFLTILLVTEIVYVLYKIYAYFCQKDKFALWDMLRTLVYD